MPTNSLLEAFCKEHKIPLFCGEPLGRYCTFQIGGPVDWLIKPSEEVQIQAVVRLSVREGIPLLVLGKGSNVLVSDKGFRGIAMQLSDNFSLIGQKGETLICQSGMSLNRLCLFARDHGLSGLEFAYGIPGTVGGAAYMNAGAYGGEMKDVLVSVRHVEPDGHMEAFSGDELGLSYRRSIYSDGNRIITGIEVRLTRDDPTSIKARMDDYMERRRSKQPLDYPSAGSTFKRPDGAYASALIDQCGLKGRRVGRAVVSEKHAGFIVNEGGASYSDVTRLINEVRDEVKAKTGYELECEVRIVE